MTAPSVAQARKMKQALLEHKDIDAVGDEFRPGLMGYQIDVHLTNVDDYQFSIYVEDIRLNCEWAIVELASGVYETEFEGDDGLVATVEVRRFPEVSD